MRKKEKSELVAKNKNTTVIPRDEGKARGETKDEGSSLEETKGQSPNKLRNQTAALRWGSLAKVGTGAVLGAVAGAVLSTAYETVKEPAQEEGKLKRRLKQPTENFHLFPQSIAVFGELEIFNDDDIVEDLEVFCDLVRAEDLLLGILDDVRNVKAPHERVLVAKLFFAYRHFSLSWSFSETYWMQVNEGLSSQQLSHIFVSDFEPAWLSARAILTSTINNIIEAIAHQYQKLNENRKH